MLKRVIHAGPVSFVLALALLAVSSAPLFAAGRPTFGVSFDATSEYLRIGRGTTDGLKGGYLGPDATRGMLLDELNREVGTFVAVHVDDYEAIIQVASFETGKGIADVEHLAIPDLDLDFITFTREDSGAYFRIDKGRDQIDSGTLKRAAKGRLFDERGRVVALYSVVAVGQSESLGVVTQFDRGFFAKDAQTGDITGYFAQILQSTGLANLTFPNLLMILIGLTFIYLAIVKDYEPLLLVPIGFGVLMGNIPLPLSIFNSVSVYMIDPVSHEYTFNTSGNSVLGIIYFGVRAGVFPAADLPGHRGADRFHRCCRTRRACCWARRPRSASSPPSSARCGSGSPRRAPRRSESSAARTAPRPSSLPAALRPPSSGPSPSPPTATWPWCRSSSRPS
jgi:hypothetical protein